MTDAETLHQQIEEIRAATTTGGAKRVATAAGASGLSAISVVLVALFLFRGDVEKVVDGIADVGKTATELHQAGLKKIDELNNSVVSVRLELSELRGQVTKNAAFEQRITRLEETLQRHRDAEAHVSASHRFDNLERRLSDLEKN